MMRPHTAFSVLWLAVTCVRGDLSSEWAAYVEKHELRFTADEFQFREKVYAANLERASRLQAENPLAEFGETIFSHLTQEEFESAYLGSNPIFNVEKIPETNFTAQSLPPTTFDWNSVGVISPVKDQGQCGSCWAFSAVETIESYWYLAGGPKVTLSPEQIVDCDKTDGGCQGGYPVRAYIYVYYAGGLDTEASYPYHAGNGAAGACAFNPSTIGAKITRYSQLNGEIGIYQQVSRYGPVSICVDASQWNAYRGGVVTSCTNNVDHCVQLTGYANYPSGYWVVRNSWGTSWGMDGYIHLAIGHNVCNLGSSPTIVSI